jgi:predicted nuclease of predicted toxin-antitoxin system
MDLYHGAGFKRLRWDGFLIGTYAKDHSLTIVSKDSDFRDQADLEGFPPKVIWLRIGNSTTMAAAIKLRRAQETIDLFLQDSSVGILGLR